MLPLSRRNVVVGAAVLVAAASLLAVWHSRPHSGEDRKAGAPPAGEPISGFSLQAPKAIANVAFQDVAGRKVSLADFKGRVVLLNIWATWCAPCREEMPTLDRLQSQLGGVDFEVVALSIDHDGPAVVRRFFDETRVHALKLYVDTSAEAMPKLEIVGVPTTILLDRSGREVARHTGIANWGRPEVFALINRYLVKEAQ